MANTKIREIANTIPLGENKFSEGQLLDAAMYAGHVVIKTATGIALCNVATGDILGVLKEHYEYDLDSEIAAGKYGDVVTEGKCAVKIVDPAATLYPGTNLYSVVATPGFLTKVVAGAPVAKLLRTVNTGDTVAIVSLIRP